MARIKYLFQGIIVLSFLFGCSKNKQTSDSYILRCEIKVIDTMFLKLVGTKFYTPLKETSGITDNSKRVSIAKMILFVKDTLSGIKNINKEISKYSKAILQKKYKIDTSYYPLYEQLFSDNLESRKLDLNEIKNKGLYELKPIYSKSQIKEPNRIIGNVEFSRVVFSQDLNKCCFYYSINYGRDLGFGYILFLKKVKNLWEIDCDLSVWQK